MSAQLLDLTARQHRSRVLDGFLARTPGAAERAAVTLPRDEAVNTIVSSGDRAGMAAMFGSTIGPSGFAVTDRTAMLVSTVYSCLTKLAGAILQLPIHQYTLNNNGERDRVRNTPLSWLLNEAPITGGAWTAASWKEWIVRCVMLRGDQHTQILRNAAGAITGLLPLHPDYVQARRLQAADGGLSGAVAYDVCDEITGRIYGVAADDMLHFASFGFDGLRSLSCIQQAARNAIGNSLAGADFMGRTLGSGAMPKVALHYPNKLTPEQANIARNSFADVYMGGNGARLPIVMTEGGTVKELSISPLDMELLAGRRFEREDICQATGVPPVLIGDNDKTSSWGTGIEQITLGFVRFTIKPHLCRWEEELNRKLFRRAGQFVEFELDGLLRGDSKAQADAFRAALGGPGLGDAYMTVNEVRKLKNLPPDPAPEANQLFKAQSKPAPTTGATP